MLIYNIWKIKDIIIIIIIIIVNLEPITKKNKIKIVIIIKLAINKEINMPLLK